MLSMLTILIAPIINAIHDLSDLIKQLGNDNKSQDRSLASINERLSKLESDNKALIKKNIELENELNNYKRNK